MNQLEGNTKKKESIAIRIVAPYLDIARFDNSLLTVPMLPDQLGRLHSMMLGKLSIKILYSYMALDTFINTYLHMAWNWSKRFYEIDKPDVEKHTNGTLMPKWTSDEPSLRKYYEKYVTQYESFEDYTRRGETNLIHRLKRVCKVFGIKPYGELNGENLAKIKRLRSEQRHFLVHLDHSNFGEGIKNIMSNKDVIDAPEIVIHFMKYFLNERGVPIPDYMNHKTLLDIKDFGVYFVKEDKSK